MKNLRVTVRIEKQQRLRLEEIVAMRKFKNLSAVIRKALKEFLSKEVSKDE